MLENVIKKLFPIRDEQGRPCTFPTFASQVFFNDGSALEGKEFGGGEATVDPLTIYPVGSIYMSDNETSPAALFGGTWEQIKDRFLLGAGGSYTLGDTGGEAEHTLTVDELASHNHGLIYSIRSFAETRESSYQATGTSEAAYYYWAKAEGGNQPHNNMPPFEAVNIWKRVA